MVNAVFIASVFTVPCMGSSSCAMRSAGRETQIIPLAWSITFTMAGVISCAAQIRSPSFSRSWSSATTTNFPFRMSSMASATVPNGMPES
jgi:hypothetical protein